MLQETFSGSQPPPSPDATCLSANSVVVLMLLRYFFLKLYFDLCDMWYHIDYTYVIYLLNMFSWNYFDTKRFSSKKRKKEIDKLLGTELTFITMFIMFRNN